MKIGAITYINTRPLIYDLKLTSKLAPEQLANSFEAGECDTALLSTSFSIKNSLKIYPEVGMIGCNGPVDSVILFTKKGIDNFSQIKSIYFDNESVTATELTKVILKNYHGINMSKLIFINHQDRHLADACLLIGDKALFPPNYVKEYQCWDMGEEWKKQTGKGFMFACWSSKKKLTITELSVLERAKKKGLSNIDSIISTVGKAKQDRVQRYLQQAIVYEFTKEIKEGYQLFKELLKNNIHFEICN